MLKVHMLPTPAEAENDQSNSINQIVLRLKKHLPAFGVEIVQTHAEADLLVGHAGQTARNGAVDVAHCHGLYPTAYPHLTQGWHWAANRAVIANLVGAKMITVPSEWVAMILRRDMHVDPVVVGWAIEPSEWEPGEDQGYILWNKNRPDGVCDPRPVLELATRTPEQRFITTFAEGGTPNVRVIGRQHFPAMKEFIRHASVYLSTTKETFGIGTLEAMACGIPVLGFRHGATPDIVQHGVTGYLVEPGDFDGLREGLDYCLKYRDVLGANARDVARTYTWDKVAKQFAQVYRAAMQPHAGPKVSVVIPCYNYGKYVGDAIRSVATQQTQFDFEVIVVDDGSTDDSSVAAAEALSELKVKTSLITKSNEGVAHARNTGIEAARGEYIACLDADDMIGSAHFLQALADTLDANPSLGIAFTSLRLMDASGNLGSASQWPNDYNYDQQVQGHNQIPTCCMFRKEAWRRAGGYRPQYQPAEDAELWLRIGALGYGAMHAIREPWFLYRLHSNSLTSTIRTGQRPEPDWTGDKHWIRTGQRPFAADGKPPSHSWPVRNYDTPKVSIIMPVSQHHKQLLLEALDSIEAQTERSWECIVVDDSPIRTYSIPSHPWVKIIHTGGEKGAGYARNRGIEAALAPLITFLDADDLFHPQFLEKMLRAHAKTGRYIYSDWVALAKSGVQEMHETPEYDPNEMFRRMSMHSINVLMRKKDALAVVGFDESMKSWEDVDFFMKLAAAGICGARVPEPLILYRYQTGQLREFGETIKPELKGLLRNRYADYMEGNKLCSCVQPAQQPNLLASLAAGQANGQQMVRIEYNGATGAHSVIGIITKQSYGRRERGDIFYVFAADANADPRKFVPLAEVESQAEGTLVPPPPEPIHA